MVFGKHTKVFTVFSFLRLRSPDIRCYQWFYPSVLCVIIVFGFLWINYDAEKLIADINSLMGILVGFYIAALAAVSSFPNKNLDQDMKGRPLTLKIVRQGQKSEETLTRRRFLAVLFGYCAILSIIIYIFGALSVHLTFILTPPVWIGILIWLAQIVYTWMICSLLVVTLLGLHYLVERIHRA